MSKGDTEIKMEFVVAGEAKAQAVTNSIYRNQTSMMRASVKQADWMSSSFLRASGSLMRLGAGFATVAGAGAIMREMGAATKQFNSTRSEMERTITPLVSIGDNVKHIAALRAEVVELSATMGRDNGEVAGFLNDLQSATGNLSADEVRQLKEEIVELSLVKGGNVGDIGNMMVSAWQIAGKELKNVNQLQNKIAYTEELGKANILELAQRLPEILSAGQLTGLSLDESLATVAGGMLKTGSIEKTMTGMRNMFLIMANAQEKGITISGTYFDKLKQIDTLFKNDPQKAFKVFGSEVAITAADISSSTKEIETAFGKLASMDPAQDIVGGKLKDRMEDPRSYGASVYDMNQSLQENASSIADDSAYSKGASSIFRRWQIGSLAGKVSSPGVPGAGFLGGIMGAMGNDTTLDAGRAIEIGNVSRGPMRDKLIAEDTKARRQQAHDRLMMGQALDMQMGGMPSAPKEIVEARLGQKPWNQRRAELLQQDAASGAPMNMGGGQRESVDVKENTNAMKELLGAIKELAQNFKSSARDNAKNLNTPGGAKTHYQGGP